MYGVPWQAVTVYGFSRPSDGLPFHPLGPVMGGTFFYGNPVYAVPREGRLVLAPAVMQFPVMAPLPVPESIFPQPNPAPRPNDFEHGATGTAACPCFCCWRVSNFANCQPNMDDEEDEEELPGMVAPPLRNNRFNPQENQIISPISRSRRYSRKFVCPLEPILEESQ